MLLLVLKYIYDYCYFETVLFDNAITVINLTKASDPPAVWKCSWVLRYSPMSRNVVFVNIQTYLY